MNYTHNTCVACLAVKRMKEANIWVHQGDGKYDPKSDNPYLEKYRKDFVVKHDSFVPNTLLEMEKIANFKMIRGSGMFDNKVFKRSLGSDKKPWNVLWLFDRYCGETHDTHCSNINEKKPVVAIQNPKNILEVKTGKEFEDFVTKYCPKPTNESWLPGRDIYKIVFWEKIREDGFYGVSFDFRKVYELEFPPENKTRYYDWHMGFDVESLCVWDLRAFDEEGVYPINLSFV
jgi:hypothetical protein